MSEDTNHGNATVDELDGERGMPSVNEGGPSSAKRGLIAVVFLLFLAMAGGVAYWKYEKNQARLAESTQKKDMQITSVVPTRTFGEPPAVPGPAPAPAPAQGAVTVVPAPNGAPAGTAPALPGGAAGNGTANAKPPQVLDKAGSSLMAGGKNSRNGAPAADAETGPGEAAPAAPVPGSVGAMLSSTSTPVRMARMLGNRNFILAEGAYIDCSLRTKLNSTVPGKTACDVTRNIYSDNGKVLLVERGSVVTGEYQANLRQGMARIFILWTRIKTPNGVIIRLDSPGTDPLGGGGVPGYIDNHFWQRFGGALMLSLVDDVARGVTGGNGSGSGGNQVNFGSTGEATQNMAAEALKNTINIPPTLYKNQGEQVGIFVARDLDFSSVYDVTAQ
jgi:type IV secretion system protein VirB10